MELWRLVAHRHWFTLRIFDREMRVCARCSGYLIGFFSLTAFRNFFVLPIFHSLKIPHQLLLCFLFVVPLTYDWLTQSWGLRDSNNKLRLLTGAVLGIGVSLLYSSEAIPFFKTQFYVSIAVLIACFGLVGEFLSEISSPFSRV